METLIFSRKVKSSEASEDLIKCCKIPVVDFFWRKQMQAV